MGHWRALAWKRLQGEGLGLYKLLVLDHRVPGCLDDPGLEVYSYVEYTLEGHGPSREGRGAKIEL